MSAPEPSPDTLIASKGKPAESRPRADSSGSETSEESEREMVLKCLEEAIEFLGPVGLIKLMLDEDLVDPEDIVKAMKKVAKHR